MGTEQGKCRFKNGKAKATAIAGFLRSHGDNLPESSIKNAISPTNLEHWHIVCDDKGKIASGTYWEKSDWYLCTIKNLATRPDQRRKGFAAAVADKARIEAKDSGCLVLAADITYDNVASQKVFEKVGFKKINTFCWEKEQKPADILHYVILPPTGDICI